MSRLPGGSILSSAEEERRKMRPLTASPVRSLGRVRHKQKSVTSHLRSLRYCPLPAHPLDLSPLSRTLPSRLRRRQRLLCHPPQQSQIHGEACHQEISSKSYRQTIGQHKCYLCCRPSCYQVQATRIRPYFSRAG